MTDWWESPYSGGGPARPQAFPRPLYPPDSASKGKNPSVPGPDVEAYKRTISRLGRWPWQEFDQSFSNHFSHGKPGGNVADSGIAGFQRQMHLDATGWIGKKTYDALRFALVPEGLPNAGQQGMDATAVVLLDEAFDQFGGIEPAPPAGSVRSLALACATGEIGTAESPSGSNRNKYGKWYGMDGVPWCAIFCTWAYLTVDPQNKSFVKGSRWAYCPYIVADARAGRHGLRTTDDPLPGDLVVYDWSGDTVYDHVGLFQAWVGHDHFTAIEGNTSAASNSNGGQVMERTRLRSGQGTVFVRVRE